MVKRKVKRKQGGDGFFGDVFNGLKSVGRVGNDLLKKTKIISTVAPLFGPKGVVIGNAAGKLGYGKRKRKRGGCKKK